MTKTWDNLLEELIEESEFKKSIEEKGFYKSNVSLKIFAKKYNFQPSQNTATYLSINFWSEQSKILRKNKLYLLRTGSGQFGIFDENTFPSPYLQLDTTNSEKLDLDVHDDFKELMSAFDTRQENAGLEHLNACGVYDSLIEKLFGDKKWKLGPRGNKISEFKVFGKTKHDKIIPIYDFKGFEELDYGIWTKDHILLFEAKTQEVNCGLDVGWHKLAYPASRFKKFNNHSIVPIYLLKWGNTTHLFVFPKFRFHNNEGIIINDLEQLKPERCFKINFESLPCGST